MPLDPIDLIPEFAFWRDGCRTMAQNICAVLRLAGEPVTPANVMQFAETLPHRRFDLESDSWRREYCSQCLMKAWEAASGAKAVRRHDALFAYFFSYFVDRSYPSQVMLKDAIVGILGGLTLDGEKEADPR
jgi:hypothetical protein